MIIGFSQLCVRLPLAFWKTCSCYFVHSVMLLLSESVDVQTEMDTNPLFMRVLYTYFPTCCHWVLLPKCSAQPALKSFTSFVITYLRFGNGWQYICKWVWTKSVIHGAVFWLSVCGCSGVWNYPFTVVFRKAVWKCIHFCCIHKDIYRVVVITFF